MLNGLFVNTLWNYNITLYFSSACRDLTYCTCRQ